MRSFHHPFPPVESVGSSFRPGQVNEKEFAGAHLLHGAADAIALFDNDLQDGVRS